jgi:hypothetical protein
MTVTKLKSFGSTSFCRLNRSSIHSLRKPLNSIKPMITRTKILQLALLLWFGTGLSGVASTTLLLDFGPTTVVSTDATLDMGHFAGAVPTAEISWNKIINADSSSLIYSDGSAAAGVSIIVGRSAVGVSNVISFSNKNISSSALGAITTGIYSNTSPLKDGIFATGTFSVNTNGLGIRIDGLAPGTYTLYISGRNSNTGNTAPEQFFATNGPLAATFPFAVGTTPSATELNSAAPAGSAANTGLAVTSTFAFGENCTLLTVTLNANDSIYLTAIGVQTNELRGFLNAVDIVPGLPVLTNFPAAIVTQPASVSVYEGANVTIGNAKFGGMPPLFYQWYFGGAAIAGATNSTLTLSNVTAGQSGNYTVSVQNSVATSVSSNAVVTIVPLDNTMQMTNIWNILPGDTNHFYITTTGGGERGLAYNPLTTNLLVLAHVPTNNLVALDPATGNQKYLMNVSASGMATTAAGINMVGVADDGKVYAGNVVADASSSSTPYQLWQWADDGSNTVAVQLFGGDPGYNTPAAGLRWGDNIAVRGAGPNTQILIAPGVDANGLSTNVVLLTTPDGTTFNPIVIGVSGVTAGFAQNGLCFGPGTNTFWAKTKGQQLYLVQFDLTAQTGSVAFVYGPTNNVPSTFQFISTDPTQKWLAGVMSVASGLPDNVRLYDVSKLTNDPVLADQELNPTSGANGFNNGLGVGSSAFGGNYLFTLDNPNGVRAFLINTNTGGGLAPFAVTSIAAPAGSAIVLSWSSVPGHSYQVQAKTSLLDAEWSNVGPAITATDVTTSATNSLAGPTQFYRIQGQ